MEQKIIDIRDGIFALRTRRFGTVAEIMIQKLVNASRSLNQFHDLYDEAEGKRLEVKFSTVMKANEAVINESNILEQCLKANTANRAMKSDEIHSYPFDCNIQQVKRAEFDILYFGLFFADRIAIFSAETDEITSMLGYSDFQHKGNEGEGQFHLNQTSIDYYMKHHFVQWLSYEELYTLLDGR